MLSFLARTPPKTPQVHLTTIPTEDGQTALESFAHDPKAEAQTFLIHAGTVRATLEGRDRLVPAGASVPIAPGLYHTFRNDSETDPLVVSTDLDPTERARDEAFFRNLYCYLDDCRKAGMPPACRAAVSLFALLRLLPRSSRSESARETVQSGSWCSCLGSWSGSGSWGLKRAIRSTYKKETE